MASVEWTAPAFAQLERFPEALAFEVVRRVDLLAQFPGVGASLESRFPTLINCRQLISSRTHRVIYEVDEVADRVYILAVQHCRQKLPTMRDLRRRRNKPDTEDEA